MNFMRFWHRVAEDLVHRLMEIVNYPDTAAGVWSCESEVILEIA